ncbi:hypothetical protein P9G84_22120 [Brevibacillus centrosporus]|uniref:hypothetical protein n=1 Tax=Brevibacillus centrosporus TaxID=54910 RepID=UPI000F0A0DB0|nr:hypothetical protein [Brevibacillus centrosporus]MEC2131624.1 hypothetical protein [Brevibacillus centrosporus]RNB72112.1 hypothetical protein EDM55_06880 [Brevibacillus centrosporus]
MNKSILLFLLLVLILSGCGTSREFLVVKYNDQGKAITSYHVKGFQPTKNEDGVSFFMTHGRDQQFIQMSGNVDVIEVTGTDVKEVMSKAGIDSKTQDAVN